MKIPTSPPIVVPIIMVFWGSLFWFAGCRDQGESLKSLSEPKLSSEFNSSFWLRQRQDKTPLWEEAIRACSGGGAQLQPRPNCMVVALVADDGRQHGGAAGEDQGRTAPNTRADARSQIGDGLTGHGAQAGSLPSLKP